MTRPFAIFQITTLLLLFSAVCAAQTTSVSPCVPPTASNVVRWVASYSKTGTSSAITIQQPATGGGTNYVQCVAVSCELACTVAFSQNGTAASTTALTVNSINSAMPNVTAFRDSNAGSGTALVTWSQGAASTVTYIVEAVLNQNTTANNFTTTVTMSSGAITIGVKGYQANP